MNQRRRIYTAMVITAQPRINLETRNLETAEIRFQVVDDKPRLSWYAAQFETLSEDLGGFKEVIKAGAFDRSIATGADIRALVNHDPSKILGRSSAGTLRLSIDRR